MNLTDLLLTFQPLSIQCLYVQLRWNLLSALTTTTIHTSLWSHDENIQTLQTHNFFIFRLRLLIVLVHPDVICLSYHIVLQKKSLPIYLKQYAYHVVFVRVLVYYIKTPFNNQSMYFLCYSLRIFLCIHYFQKNISILWR